MRFFLFFRKETLVIVENACVLSEMMNNIFCMYKQAYTLYTQGQ